MGIVRWFCLHEKCVLTIERTHNGPENIVGLCVAFISLCRHKDVGMRRYISSYIYFFSYSFRLSHTRISLRNDDLFFSSFVCKRINATHKNKFHVLSRFVFTLPLLEYCM